MRARAGSGASLDEEPKLRFYRAGDEEGLLALFQSTFAGWPTVASQVRAIDHLRWKLPSALQADRYTTVAEAGDRLVAARPFVICPTKVLDRVLRLRNGFDTAVHPDYQGRGLMTAMRAFHPERFTEEVDLHIGYGDHPAFASMRKREDMHYFGNTVDVLTLDPPVALSPTPAPWRIVDAPRFDERIDSFFAEAAVPFDFIVERSKEFLNWRYADPRAGSFRLRVAESGSRILGYAVLSASNGRAYIADVLALPGRLDVVSSLLDDAIDYAVREQAAALECWCPAHHPYRSVLAGRGFRHKRRLKPVYLALRLPAADLDFLADRKAAIHFQLGDTDLV
jgi:GNAT superfamily N-acetyltransferase